MADSYEAMAFSAHLPNRCIAFIYKDRGQELAGGIYSITRVRTATEDDQKAFHTPVSDDCCPLCGQVER